MCLTINGYANLELESPPIKGILSKKENKTN